MNTSRQFRIYNQKFTFPLKTAHGVWKRRTSLILEEKTMEKSVTEVAPTPGFADCSLQDLMPEARAWVRGKAQNTDRFSFPLSRALRVKFASKKCF